MYVYIYNLFIGGVVVVVTGVRPASGSLEGGATITIDGSYFDNTDAPATVDIDGKTALFVCVYNVYVRTLSTCQYHSYLYPVRACIETINVSSVITVNDEKSNDKKIYGGHETVIYVTVSYVALWFGRRSAMQGDKRHGRDDWVRRSTTTDKDFLFVRRWVKPSNCCLRL